MIYPISVKNSKIKIKPEYMDKEKLYYCLFNNKIILFYKDTYDALNCFEIEEDELVNKIKLSNNAFIDGILIDYITKKNLKH